MEAFLSPQKEGSTQLGDQIKQIHIDRAIFLARIFDRFGDEMVTKDALFTFGFGGPCRIFSFG
jgi:hypothetical protein